MKGVILVGMVIFLLIVGFIPLHELGHIIVAKALGGEVRDVTWLSFSSITDSQGEYYGGWFYVENIYRAWKWVLIFLSGGLFQCSIYVTIGLIFSSRKFARSKKRKAFNIIFSTCFVLGMLGLVASVCEFWMANQGIYPS